MKRIVLAGVVVLTTLSMNANPIDFSKIKHWTGHGPNMSAVALRFEDTSKTLVWGFCWEDGESPTGEDMMRAVCADSDNLLMLTQYTGQYGSTLCGIGYGNSEILLDRIWFDFDMAKNYEWINFDYYSVNPFFGQSEAPGDNTPSICRKAITAARDTHVIQHPIDYKAYGYPAYDYDCWKLDEKGSDGQIWLSGWYTGYWSYWLGSVYSEDWEYSGSGFSGRKLVNGSIDAWTYTVFDKPGVGGVGEGTPPEENPSMIEYVPASVISEAESVVLCPDSDNEYYTLSGVKVCPSTMSRGIYIVKKGQSVRKIFVK